MPDILHSGAYDIKVTGSGGLSFTNETSLHYQAKSISIFIQTDKAMYKPGQTGRYQLFEHVSSNEKIRACFSSFG